MKSWRDGVSASRVMPLGFESLGDSLKKSLDLGGLAKLERLDELSTALKSKFLIAATVQNGNEEVITDDTKQRDRSTEYIIHPAIPSPPLPCSTYHNPKSDRHIQGQEKGQSGSANQNQES